MKKATLQEQRLFVPGMRVEVLTVENKLIFLGMISNVSSRTIQIRAADGTALPTVIYNTPVKLRNISAKAQIAVLYGTVCGSTDYFWKLDQLRGKLQPDLRASYRQRTDLHAYVLRMDDSGIPTDESEPMSAAASPCSILDISTGGVLLWCAEEHQIGDRLMLTHVRVIPEEREFTLLCRVQRLGEEHTYGCAFEEMSTKDEERLNHAIFTLQRREIQIKRERP